MCLQLGDALQVSTQATVELKLQQKLREDDQLRVEELEESLLEKNQELQKLYALVSRLQGEVLSLHSFQTWALHVCTNMYVIKGELKHSSLWYNCKFGISLFGAQVSGKLIDKERTLEEEIQLRERLQLQCKQAERTVDDLTMELHTTNQTKDDLAKQLKQAQVPI